VLGQTLDPREVGERVADRIRALLGVESSLFYRVDREAGTLHLVARAGAADDVLRPDVALPPGTGMVGLAVTERRAVSTPDFLADPRPALPADLRRRLAGVPYRAVLALPLIAHGRVIGALALGHRRGHVFTEEDALLGQAFADQAALALENARLYAEARASNRAKDEFLATLSHELRTPLTAMLGWVRMLRSRVLDPPTVARGLEVIERNVRLQAQLIEDLLDVSRIIAGKVALELRPVDPAEGVEAALDAVTPSAESRRIELVKRADPDTGLLEADAARLQQVVWNLLSNAIKFVAEGGRVEVRLDAWGPHVRLRVTDNGPGISRDFLPHIFDRFRQADSTTTRAHGGLGVGLAIVRHLVELQGGTVSADSPGPGQGATFTVLFPRLGDAAPGVSAAPRGLQ
jgi:signal transduction histidine kinase